VNLHVQTSENRPYGSDYGIAVTLKVTHGLHLAVRSVSFVCNNCTKSIYTRLSPVVVAAILSGTDTPEAYAKRTVSVS